MSRSIIVAVCLWLVSLQTATAAKDQYYMPVSKSKAKLWSIGATFAPMVAGGGLLYASFGEGSDNFVIWGLTVGSAGLVFGPGAGHAYAKQPNRFWIGTLVRASAGGLFVLGVTEVELFGDGDNSGAFILMSLGSAAVLVSAIYDIATVGKSVDIYNHSHGFSDVRIAPTYLASHKAPGVILTLSF